MPSISQFIFLHFIPTFFSRSFANFQECFFKQKLTIFHGVQIVQLIEEIITTRRLVFIKHVIEGLV